MNMWNALNQRTNTNIYLSSHWNEPQWNKRGGHFHGKYTDSIWLIHMIHDNKSGSHKRSDDASSGDIEALNTPSYFVFANNRMKEIGCSSTSFFSVWREHLKITVKSLKWFCLHVARNEAVSCYCQTNLLQKSWHTWYSIWHARAMFFETLCWYFNWSCSFNIKSIGT